MKTDLPFVVYGGEGDRLSADEAEVMANRSFMFHNHFAPAPQDPIFWVRVREDFRV